MKVARTSRSRDVLLRNVPRWRPAAILDFIEPEIAPFENPILEPSMKWIGDPLLVYGHLKFSKMAAGRHLGFG